MEREAEAEAAVEDRPTSAAEGEGDMTSMADTIDIALRRRSDLLDDSDDDWRDRPLLRRRSRPATPYDGPAPAPAPGARALVLVNPNPNPGLEERDEVDPFLLCDFLPFEFEYG